jgi:hypothetical protein
LIHAQLLAALEDTRLGFHHWFHDAVEQGMRPKPASASIGAVTHEVNMAIDFHKYRAARAFGAGF